MRPPLKNNTYSNNYNMGMQKNYGQASHFDENQSAFDSKYSPSRGGPNATAYSKDLYSANNGFYE